MTKLMISTMAAALALSFAMPANAAATKNKVSAEVQADCKAQAAKKFSAVHFLKRRAYTKNCIARHAGNDAAPKAKASAAKVEKTDQPAATTGQAKAQDKKTAQ
ncbi:MAG: hypothetical protein JO245_01710 [Pseudolabrys sp.]|nr:hypothetical protein [Pseudolabrys sp.]